MAGECDNHEAHEFVRQVRERSDALPYTETEIGEGYRAALSMASDDLMSVAHMIGLLKGGEKFTLAIEMSCGWRGMIILAVDDPGACPARPAPTKKKD